MAKRAMDKNETLANPETGEVKTVGEWIKQRWMLRGIAISHMALAIATPCYGFINILRIDKDTDPDIVRASLLFIAFSSFTLVRNTGHCLRNIEQSREVTAILRRRKQHICD